ncbi:YkoF family thiamine/hydroxymethylpyrimidine-binding protein [Aquimarina rhabdastrellae]
MKVSVELTLTPLQDDFETPIKEFIKELRTSKFVVMENPLSTQVYGDFDEVIPFLTTLIKKSFGTIENGVLQMKLVKSDRSDYEPDF